MDEALEALEAVVKDLVGRVERLERIAEEIVSHGTGLERLKDDIHGVQEQILDREEEAESNET